MQLPIKRRRRVIYKKEPIVYSEEAQRIILLFKDIALNTSAYFTEYNNVYANNDDNIEIVSLLLRVRYIESTHYEFRFLFRIDTGELINSQLHYEDFFDIPLSSHKSSSLFNVSDLAGIKDYVYRNLLTFDLYQNFVRRKNITNIFK